MTLLETLVCLLQQYAAEGVEVVSTDPLEIEGPDESTARFAEVFRFLREYAAQDGHEGLPDKAIRRLLARPQFCGLGGVDWETAFPAEWAFTIHEQKLLADGLGRQVWYHGTPLMTGRLEGIRPRWCFVTLGEPRPVMGDPVSQFLQRTGSAVKVSSLLVELSPVPPAVRQAQEAGETCSLAEVARVREEIAIANGIRRPKKPPEPESMPTLQTTREREDLSVDYQLG